MQIDRRYLKWPELGGWTVEYAEDLKNLHGIDIDEEMCEALSYEIAKGVAESINPDDS